MFQKIKSLTVIFIVQVQKIFDNGYRYLFGIPTLKRSKITANLYLGGQYNIRGLKKLKKMGITAIVNMRTSSIYAEAKYEGIKYLHLPTIDQTPPALEDLIKGAAFIEEEINNNGKVYIHCHHGQGRGPSMAIAYLIKKGATFEDAFSLVKSVRTFIKPTPGQTNRLKEFETICKIKF